MALLSVEAVALVLVVSGGAGALLPTGVALRLGRNSEAFALALVLTSFLLARRRGLVGTRGWVGLVLAGLLVLLGVSLLQVDEPRLRTLNEPLIAGGLLVAYCLPRRPVARIWTVGPGVLVAVAVLSLLPAAPAVRDQAEALTALVLAPLGLDLVAPRSLDPDGPFRRRATWAWIGLLTALPLLLVAAPDVRLVEEISRGNEGVWGLALVHLALLLDGDRGYRGRHARTGSPLLGKAPRP
ncbi:hypothetical protein [Nocardioides salarius]|uniref:hypothetical protein n=1 Tax=Nocardioides salarius TaxID=374513 RepID=UPI0030F72898